MRGIRLLLSGCGNPICLRAVVFLVFGGCFFSRMVTAAESSGPAPLPGSNEAAFRLFAERAVNGDPVAENNLGALYLKGKGTARNFDLARKWFEQAAKQGFPVAKQNLGMIYLRGYGVVEDPVVAARWMEAAAADGEREAQFFTALFYYRGNGVTQDYQRARQWFGRAADQGLVSAIYNLAAMQLAGKGGPRDETRAMTALTQIRQGSDDAALLMGQVYLEHGDEAEAAVKALTLFKPLAEAGNPTAQCQLGLMYIAGRGVPNDYEEGRFWLQQASRQGSSLAQLNLGNVYTRGLGVPRDLVEAAAWFSLSAINGELVANQNLAKVHTKMSAVEITRAEARATALREKYPQAMLMVRPRSP